MFSTPFLFLLRTTFVLYARPLTGTCQKSQQFNARKSLWLMSMIKFSLDNCWTKGLFLFITYFVVTCLCCSLSNFVWALAWQRNKARGQKGTWCRRMRTCHITLATRAKSFSRSTRAVRNCCRCRQASSGRCLIFDWSSLRFIFSRYSIVIFSVCGVCFRASLCGMGNVAYGLRH